MSRNSWVDCGSRPEVGSSRIAISARFIISSARPSRWRMPREKVATRLSATSDEPHPRQRLGDPLLAHVAAKAHQPRRIGEVLGRRHVVVEADRVGQIADPALDRERLAHRIVARDPHLAGGYLGEAEHHQDGGGLAGAVRPQQAEGLALEDVEVEGVDDDALAVALGERRAP